MIIINNIILYSTGCPKCKILKNKLDNKGIEYTEVNNLEAMLGLNIDTVPVLFCGDKRMEFKEAIEWVNKQ